MRDFLGKLQEIKNHNNDSVKILGGNSSNKRLTRAERLKAMV